MFCNNCGNKLDDGAKFCMNCGKPVEAAPKTAVPQFAVASDLDANSIPKRTPAPAPAQNPGPVPVYSSPVRTPKQEYAPAQEARPAPKPAPVAPPRREAPAAPASYYAAPAAPKKKSGISPALIIVLLLIAAVIGVAVWGFTDGWLPEMFSGSDGGSSSGEKEGKDEEDDPYADWNKYQIGDLILYLPEEFEEDHINDRGAVFYSDDVEIEVETGDVDDLPRDVADAEELADFYEEWLEDEEEGDVITYETQNGVPYIIYSRYDDDDDVMVVGFYCDGETAWLVAAEDFDPEQAEDMVPYVTSGKVKKSSGDSGSSNDDGPVAERPSSGSDSKAQYVKCNGMTFRLDDSFEEEYVDDAYAEYSNDSIYVEFSSGSMSDVNDDIKSSREFAEFYMEIEELEASLEQNNGVYYVVDAESDEIIAFYVEGGTGWLARAESDDFGEDFDMMVEIVTSGKR